MFNVEKYICLYINEYVNYIFKNLEEKEKLQDEIKKQLLIQINDVIKKLTSIFEITMSRNSIKRMCDYNEIIRNSDSNHQINYYDIYLENTTIMLEEIDKIIYLTVRIGEISIRFGFNLNSYLENKNFNNSYEFFSLNSNDCYMVASNRQIFSYNKDKYEEMNSSPNKVIYPSNIYNIGSSTVTRGFLELAHDIYEETIDKNRVIKRKMLY